MVARGRGWENRERLAKDPLSILRGIRPEDLTYKVVPTADHTAVQN